MTEISKANELEAREQPSIPKAAFIELQSAFEHINYAFEAKDMLSIIRNQVIAAQHLEKAGELLGLQMGRWGAERRDERF